MDLEEAINYCEEHECTECIVHLNNLDKRTREQIFNGTPCGENLIGLEIEEK